MKKTSTTPATLADMKDWSGDFKDLVSTANHVLPTLNPGAAPITERLARRYQEAGAVGRGRREGKSSRFGWDELASLAMTKAIVQNGWPLEGAAALVSSTPTADLAARLASESGVAGESGQPAEETPARRAQKVISELMYQTQPVVTLPGRLTSSHGPVGFASAQCTHGQVTRGVAWNASGGGLADAGVAPVVPEAKAPETWHKHALAPWLELSIAPAAAAQASPAEVARAQQTLRRLTDLLPLTVRPTPKP